MARYVLAHWRGRQGLAWSFWVNLVALRSLVCLVQEASPLDALPQAATVGVVAIAVLCHPLLLVWQAVGVVRACEAHLSDYGSMAGVWGAQLGLIVATLSVGVYGLDALHAVRGSNDDGASHEERLAERASRYRVEALSGGVARISGELEIGIVDAFEDHLERRPGTRTVELQSAGGNVYQARGLARAIRERRLDTRVTTSCSSACTLAFIGGRRRLVAPSARLGFHQYRIDADYPVLRADPRAAQAADRRLYEAAGVRAGFLGQMFRASAREMWFPSPAELLEAGVVTGIAE